jgi:Arc/MetJ-type ribon-helix-helix transcriptional regulator
MHIILFDVPEELLPILDTLCQEGGLYPSRSELIRWAVRDYLLEELPKAHRREHFQTHKTYVIPRLIADASRVEVTHQGLTEVFHLVKKEK